VSINDSNKDWYVIDATDVVLGRLASKVAHMLKGKHKPQYQPHTDEGDYIIVINAKKIRVTGNKLSDKIYYKHTGYIGNMKETPLGKMLDKKPDFVIKNAVKGMLPKNPLGRSMIKKLKVYENDIHGHGAQKPVALEV
jgi:large subunit ribosomal protein L13|tara:strand:- start:73 stop:486 length:414 start_codon:yes stop_codon:yes gene_type:complete